MRPIKDLRRDNLAVLSERFGGQSALATLLKRDRNQVYQWLLPPENPASRGIGDKMARHIELSVGLEPGWMDNITLLSSQEHTTAHGHAVSPHDATKREDHFTGVRMVRIEGAVAMDEQGYWQQGDRNAEETPFPTEDPDAYAIRILAQTFQPAVASGQCILVSPREKPRPGRPVLVVLIDGRRTLRNFHSFERGMWTFTKVNDGNSFTSLDDDQVAAVERVMAYLWTE